MRALSGLNFFPSSDHFSPGNEENGVRVLVLTCEVGGTDHNAVQQQVHPKFT
jgi:hypothetical protein